MNRLKDKRALITGGTTGIGLETARQFLKEGARVAITGRNPATLEVARKELGGDVLILPSDASDIAAQKTLAETLRHSFGQIDILFVNAGVAEVRPVEQWDEAAFDRSFAINLKGPFSLIQALLPIFANPASIVLNASVNAHIGMPNTSVTFWRADLARYPRECSQPRSISTPLYGKLGLSEADLKAASASLVSQLPPGASEPLVRLPMQLCFWPPTNPHSRWAANS